MKIALGSQSEIKQAALHNALEQLHITADVVSVATKSGVAEQPYDGETSIGALRRARHAAELVPDADLWIGIENGVFPVEDHYEDKAIVLCLMRDGSSAHEVSVGVAFPSDAVQEALRTHTTVGKVLMQQDRVVKHDDPHMSLTGVSRTTILEETLVKTLASLGNC